MKALILAGGFGTRLRPLTLTTPKPLVEFCNFPIIFHQIKALYEAGVKLVILAVSYLSDVLEVEVGKFTKELGMELVISFEKEPLGTAGPLALARKYLEKEDMPFFVLNSDIICSYPFKEMLEFHKQHNKIASIAITSVLEPSKYGVLLFDKNNMVKRFVEKPSVFISDKINAGIYLFSAQVLDMIELEPTSMEKQILPSLATSSNLYCFDLKGFWMDIGQPIDFLKGVALYISHIFNKNVIGEYEGFDPERKSIVHSSAKLGANCHIGPNVVIGRDVVIGDGVHLSHCVIMKGTIVQMSSLIRNSIIGNGCRIGSWVRIEKNSILGDDVVVESDCYIAMTKVLPHKSLNEPQIIDAVIM